ncbi:GTP 3',8-cyclase MoaA [Wansuia hejianensis]|uniref:GTP 3',8-cyclase n=1 Tax=Wansuia hejianensis TaxID=2763667 RepID=A0A926EZ30_9FIRM|nr:GTP 3',8-cyclase MoaA [Wansuia hejianensis]MBC8591008.1 GTP 3',8-cyclase MoaA [Wansuia hejianensis]
MRDSFGRNINYLRVSLTDRCNLRCRYCMPEEGINPKLDHEDIITLEETYELIKSFVNLGIDKIRFTGGEPLVRKGVLDLIYKVSKLEGIKDIAMTTNGLLLKDMAKSLKEAGLNRVNISLDTLDEYKYYNITRGGKLSRVLEGIEEALKVGLWPIKINTVLIGGFNDDEVVDLVNLTKKGIDIRFIELMPIGQAVDFAQEKFVSNDKVLGLVQSLKPVDKEDPSSPANYYALPNATGKVGLINPISCKFCNSCNRVRLTSTGKLKLCLHSNREIDLKKPLRDGKDLDKIVMEAIFTKEEKHRLEEEEYINRNMNQIGG